MNGYDLIILIIAIPSFLVGIYECVKIVKEIIKKIRDFKNRQKK